MAKGNSCTRCLVFGVTKARGSTSTTKGRGFAG
ncbi:MAG: hypothetical protein ACI97B_001750 [Verrucomicrobiales bacterium]|jgi:hypothetical protein